MNVLVLINGREAIPVRAIPRMADSTVSADILVRGLLCTKDDNPFHKLSAYELLEYECSRKVAAVEWRPAAVKLHALSDALHRREMKGELTHAEATAEWKRESVKRLPPGVFVWKDEFFRKHFERYRRLSNEELAQLHRDGLEMLRELASAPDDSYTAELMAAHGVPENWRETFQAEIDQANAEEPFNPGDYCLYVPNTCAPKATDTLSDATFSPLLEEDERFVVMEGFEHMPKAGPKNEEEQSGLVKAGEAVHILAKWLENPIDELPSYPRKIAQIYVPRWTEMSANERRAQAEEADHQVKATLGDRFEKARMDAEQTNAATPARFAQRAMQDGFDKVTREKAGEQNFEARVAAVNLTDERCIQLAHSHELRIADWTALTGIGIGWHWSYVVSAEGVAFREWTEKEIREASVDRQIEMHQDNEAMPLILPCTPARLIQFVDAAPLGSHSFSVPDPYRQAVTAIARTTDTPAWVPVGSPAQTTPSATSKEAAAPEGLPDDYTKQAGARVPIANAAPVQPDTAPSGAPARNHNPANVQVVIVLPKSGEQPTDAYRAEEARQKAIDHAELRRENERSLRAREAEAPPPVPAEQPALSGSGRSGASKLLSDREPEQGGQHEADDWRVLARGIADECFDHDTKNNCRDSLAGYSKRVMDIMQARKIHGPRGRIDNANTIQREALQGDPWWRKKAR